MADSIPGRTTFISGSLMDSELRSLVDHAMKIRVAVAYWGSGATDRLDLGSLAEHDVIVVCDLLSGACNPTEIKRLQKTLGKQRVLTRNHLHAKIWLTDRGAIVGSSNASANGLGWEGDELRGLIEANVFVDDTETLAAMGRWFEKEVLEQAREITEATLKEACRRWKPQRVNRPQPLGQNSLLDSIRLQASSYADRDIVVWIYKQHDMDRWAYRALNAEQKKRSDNSIDAWQDVDRPPPPGAYVLDFDLHEDRSVKFEGFYRVLRDSPVRKTPHGRILLCKPTRTFEGLPLGDRRTWERAATAAAHERPQSDDMQWKIEDFARFLAKPF